MMSNSTTKTEISALTTQNPTGLVVTLEGTNLFLTIILSLAALIGIIIKTTSKFNAIASEIRDLKEELNSHCKAGGHEQFVKQTEIIQKDLTSFDKKLDLHLQDYQNYKEANLLAYNGTQEKINHTWAKTEKLLNEQKGEIKELQKFLQKQQNFKIRE